MFKNSGILNISPLIFYNWYNFDLCAGRELNLSSSWDELHTRDMPWLQGLELTFQQRTLLELSQHLVIIFWQKEVNNLEEGRTADKIIQRSRAFQEGCPAQGLRSSPGRQIALGGGRSMKTQPPQPLPCAGSDTSPVLAVLLPLLSLPSEADNGRKARALVPASAAAQGSETTEDVWTHSAWVQLRASGPWKKEGNRSKLIVYFACL